MASVDESVQELMDCLDRRGPAENTPVALTSDQGFYPGEHGWIGKRFMYELSLKTGPEEVNNLVHDLDFRFLFLIFC